MVAGQPAHSPHCLRIAHVAWYPHREHCVRKLGLALLWWVEGKLCRRRPGATALGVGGPAVATSSLLRSAQEAEKAFRIISGHSATSCVPKLEFSWYELLLSSSRSVCLLLCSSPSSQTEVIVTASALLYCYS